MVESCRAASPADSKQIHSAVRARTRLLLGLASLAAHRAVEKLGDFLLHAGICSIVRCGSRRMNVSPCAGVHRRACRRRATPRRGWRACARASRRGCRSRCNSAGRSTRAGAEQALGVVFLERLGGGGAGASYFVRQKEKGSVGRCGSARPPRRGLRADSRRRRDRAVCRKIHPRRTPAPCECRRASGS